MDGHTQEVQMVAGLEVTGPGPAESRQDRGPAPRLGVPFGCHDDIPIKLLFTLLDSRRQVS
jgi:hypothetical protein